jgi:hypothetical protein
LLELACGALLAWEHTIPISHKIDFLANIGIHFPDFFGEWYRIAAQHPHSVACLNFLSELIRISPALRAHLSADLIRAVVAVFTDPSPVSGIAIAALRLLVTAAQSDPLPPEIMEQIMAFANFLAQSASSDPEILTDYLTFAAALQDAVSPLDTAAGALLLASVATDLTGRYPI